MGDHQADVMQQELGAGTSKDLGHSRRKISKVDGE